MAKSSRNNFIYLLQFLLFLLYTKSNKALECPDLCTCQDNNNLLVDCSRKLLLNVPKTSTSTLTLDLSHNSLGPRFNTSFVQMRNMTLIDLSHNAITAITECAFSGMLSLKTVHLSWNRLTLLPDGLFTDTNKVQHLNLSHNLLSELPQNPFKNLPELKTLDVSYNLIVKIKLGPRFQVPRQIEVIDMSHNLIEAVQMDSFEIATKWEASINRVINLAFCKISSIESGAILKIPRLYALDISGNNGITMEMLTSLISELETGARNLDRLSLAYMNLTTIVPLFTQVSELSLKFLDVSFNKITDLPENVFSTIRGLRVLDVSRNEISTFPAGLTDLVNLRVLNISHNALISFKGNTLAHLSNLLTLDVSHNRLNDSDNVIFLPLTKLNYLDVNNNLLTSVILPSNTSNLKFLDYHANRITNFVGLDDAEMLESVDLSDNELKTVSSFLFRGSKLMKIANFSINYIKTIDHQAFLPQSPLIIDLSNNSLKEISYSNWVATEKLYLRHNKISRIDPQTFHGMTSLQELDLSGNELMNLHEDLFHYLTNMKYLNLSHNRLNKVHWSLLFHNFEYLEMLDLGHNNISHLTEFMLLPLPKINALYLQENNLQTIIPRVFRDAINLKVIDLSNNPFGCTCDMLAFQDWLKRTKLSVLGLYMMNSSAYRCRTPHSRTGIHILNWKENEFECNTLMLYLFIACAVGAFLILVGVTATSAYRFHLKWRHKAEIKRKLKKEEYERRIQSKSIDHVRLSNLEIAEAIKDAVERKRRQSPQKYDWTDRQNNYMHQPRYMQRQVGQDKNRRYSEDRIEFREKKNVQEERGRSRERNYEKLKMAELAKEAMEKKQGKTKDEGSSRFRDKYSDKRDNYTEAHGDRRQSDNSNTDSYVYDRHMTPRKFLHPYEEVTRDAHLRDHDRLFHYDLDPYYTPSMHPARKNDPYVISNTSTLPNNWDRNEVWVIPQREVHHGYRSRSQGQRMDSYFTVPNGHYNVHRHGGRVREQVRDKSCEIFPFYAHGMDKTDPIHYTRQHRNSPESHYAYQHTQSYNFIPQAYVSKPSHFKKDRAQKEYESIEKMSKQSWIGPRAVSQPVLTTEGLSNWL